MFFSLVQWLRLSDRNDLGNLCSRSTEMSWPPLRSNEVSPGGRGALNLPNNSQPWIDNSVKLRGRDDKSNWVGGCEPIVGEVWVCTGEGKAVIHFQGNQ